MSELADNAIAIVGMSCRFPGANDLESYWRNLREGVESIRRLTDDELRRGGVSQRLLNEPGYVRAASMLDEVDQFDAGFFGFSPRQAALTDPQHRLFLQCAFEALEDAGFNPVRDMGPVGVFASSGMSHYLLAALAAKVRVAGGDEALATYIANDKEYLATQVSFRLDLQGPSLAVQSACSSSLVAVHYACQALLSRECRMALAGGVTVRVPQAAGYLHQQDGIFSADGHCRPFDAQSTGTLFGSGLGAVVLRRLEDAVSDGDRIYAVIRGSAVNNDGAQKAAYTAPSVDGQAAVIAEALAVAGVAPESISYVEAHGTGTPLGDPIEVTALERALAVDDPRAAPVAIGSVKSNLGHLEIAAGMAALIKTALALHHGELPPSLHFNTPNPHISFGKSRFFVNHRLRPWPRRETPRFAGVSSFGIGGTNAHLVLEEAPALPARAGNPEPRTVLLPLSARSPQALRSLAERYERFLTAPPSGTPGMPRASLEDIAYSAGVRRTHHRYRLAVAGRGREALGEALAAFARGERELTQADTDQPRRVVFVFPGQGCQWLGMGRLLLAREPAFGEAMARCDAVIRSMAGWSALAELGADESTSRLDQLDVVQPLIFAVQVSLAALWRSWGIEPDAVVGFSMGEVAAAHVAGALSLEDAARVICRRSRLALRVRGQGGMAMVGLSLADTQAAIAPHNGRLSVAASSSPQSTVIAGDTEAIELVLERLKQQNVFASRIRVDFASHSHHVDSLRDDLLRSLEGIRPHPVSTPMYSTVRGGMVAGTELTPAYWVRNLREPVLFASAVEQLAAPEHQVFFLEISPHPVLATSIEQSLAHHGRNGRVLPSGLRGDDEGRVMRESLGALYAHGYPVDFEQFTAPDARCVSLPRYPWQLERHWIDAAEPASDAEDAHPLLGRRLRSPLAAHQFERAWTARDPGFIAEHRILGQVVVPGAAFASLALAAGSELSRSPGVTVEQLSFNELMALDGGTRRFVHTIVDASQDAAPDARSGGGAAPRRLRVRITSVAEDQDAWTVQAEGVLVLDPSGARPAGPAGLADEPDAVRARCSERLEGEAVRNSFHEAGYHLGPTFQWLERVYRGKGEAWAELRPGTAAEHHGGHALLGLVDACFQLLGMAHMNVLHMAAGGAIFVPIAVERLQVLSGCEKVVHGHGVVRAGDSQGDLVTGDVLLRDGAGQVVVAAYGVMLRRVARATLERRLQPLGDWMHRLEWRRVEPPAPSQELQAGRWLILADARGIGARVAQHLERQGHECTLVSAPSGGLAWTQAQALAYRGVLYLPGLDATSVGQEDSAQVARALTEVGGGLLALIQQMARLPGNARLWVATHGAQAAGGPVTSPVGAALWGLGRVAAHEHADLWGGLVDVQAAGGAGAAAEAHLDTCARQLVATVLSGTAERELAWRGDTCLVPRLIQQGQPPREARTLPLRGDGSYLITGGFGGLGRVIARQLLARGAGTVVLLGRGTQASTGLGFDSDAPGRVIAMHADVSDPAALAAVLTELRRTLPPLRGVVHAAGVVEDATLANQSTERLMRAMAGKALGAWNLHRLTSEDALEFFALFSSTAAILGRPGQGPHAAANGFLDGLAWFRHGLGQPAVSIAWGPWAEVGQAARYSESARQQGLQVLAPEQGARAFEALLGQNEPHIAVTRASWKRYAEAAGLDSPIMAELVRASGADSRAPALPELREQLLRTPRDRHQELLRTYLAGVVNKLLGVRVDDATMARGLFELGMDSLRAVELRNRLQRALGRTLPSTLVFNHPNISALAAYLAREVNGGEPTATRVETPGDVADGRAARGNALAQRRSRRLQSRVDEPPPSSVLTTAPLPQVPQPQTSEHHEHNEE